MLTFGILGTIHDIVVGQPLYKAVLAIFSTIFLAFDSMVYAVVNYAYTMFTYIAGARILDSKTLVDMADRVYIVIGVIALFLVAYALLTAIINPDNVSKGENSLGKIIPNIAKAIVGIAIVPTIFTYAYKIQKEVLCENIIPRWLLEDKYETINPTKENAGAELATELFQSFFFINPDRTSNEQKSWWDSLFTAEFDENSYYGAVNNARDGEAFILAFGPLIDNVSSADITYFMLISTVAGLFCAYVLLGYCLDAGLRAIKLAYLQLLAPLPILLTIIPGQGKIFKNWLSKTVSCFLEVFVRVFAMTFVIYIINHLPLLLDSSSEIFESACGTGPGIVMLFLIRAILVCALFDFLKQAPKLVSEITGIDSKGFKLGIRDKLSEAGVFQAMAGVGGLGAATVNGAVGAGRVLGDSFRSLRNGDYGAAAKTFGKGAIKGVAGIPKKYTSAYYSYKNAKNAKTMDEVGQAISKGTAQGMSAPGFMKSAMDNMKERASKIKNTVVADYEPYNSKLNLRKAATMDGLVTKIDDFKSLIDKIGAGDIEDLQNVRDARIKKAQSDFSAGKIKQDALANELKAAREEFETKKRAVELNTIRKGIPQVETMKNDIAQYVANNPEIIKDAAQIGGGHFNLEGESVDLYGNEFNDINEFVNKIKNNEAFEDLNGKKGSVYELGNNLKSASSQIKTKAIEQDNKQKDSK